MILLLSGITVTSCRTTDKSRIASSHQTDIEPEAVITDYGRLILAGATEQERLLALHSLIERLIDGTREDFQSDRLRIPVELLFFDDAILPLLRVPIADKPEHDLVRTLLLCFIGDAADHEAHDPTEVFQSRPLIETSPSSPDLIGALSAIRQQLTPPESSFRIEGLHMNRKLTKAYVNLVIGEGAFNCEGWGAMFHRGAEGWTLVWTRFEWVS